MSKKGLPFIITLPIFNSFSLRYQINQKLIQNTFLEVGSSDLPLQIEGYFLLQCVTSKRRQYMGFHGFHVFFCFFVFHFFSFLFLSS